MAGRRRSERALRDKLRSPGRPPVARQEHRRRFWALVAEGLSSEDAAMKVGVSQPVGFRWFRAAGGMAPSHLSPSSKARLGALPDLFRSERISRCGGREVLACVRSRAVWVERRRRSRGSCGATRRRGAATWTTGRRRRSGMRSGRHVARKRRNWRPTRRCGTMCRTGWPVLSWHLAGPRCPDRRYRGRDGGTGDGRIGAGVWHGARSRLPSGYGATIRMTRRCGSATRRSTRRSTSRAEER